MTVATKTQALVVTPANKQKHPAIRQPRLGFLGTGWIGRLRMAALQKAGVSQICAVYDPSEEAAQAAAALADRVNIFSDIDSLLNADLDGIVIATPSAFHAQHCIQAIAQGKAVFCQKPLARTLAETQSVVAAARRENKLLAVDFSYRHLAGMDQVKAMLAEGKLGEVFAADLIFHNAYGPDKSWFYDLNSAGGGCVMDLGIHLVDAAMWLLNNGAAEQVTSHLFHKGKKLSAPFESIEDYATASLSLNNTQIRLCCSWNLHAGRDAIIEMHFHGTQGGITITNVKGSFYDFEIMHFTGTARQQLAGYPDDWGGRALIHWAQKLALDSAFDPDIEQALQVANVIDRIYCR